MFDQRSIDRRESLDVAPQADVARHADSEPARDWDAEGRGVVGNDTSVDPVVDEETSAGTVDYAAADSFSDELRDQADAASEAIDEAVDEAAVDEAADPDPGDLAVEALVAQIRADSAAIGAAEARRLRHVAELVVHLEGEAVAMLASLPRVPGAPQDHEVIDSAG